MKTHPFHRLLVRIRFLLRFQIVKWFSPGVVRAKKSGRRIITLALVEHMGDITACEPVSRALRSRYPDALILWFTRPGYVSLVKCFPAVDCVIPVNCLSEWMLWRDAGCFDEIVDLHIQGRVCPVCRIPLVKTEGNRNITLENYYFFGNLREVLCQAAGINVPEEMRSVIAISEKVSDKMDSLKLPQRYVAVHTRSQEMERNWVEAKWDILIQELTGRLGWSIVEIGDTGYRRNITDARYVDLCGKLTILETAEVIRRAVLFVGVDSGPAHIAQAFNRPGLILMGPYRFFQKYDPFIRGTGEDFHFELIWANRLVQDISVTEVLDKIQAKILTGQNQFSEKAAVPAGV